MSKLDLDQLHDMIPDWEPINGELISATYYGGYTLERIIKHKDTYSLYRYFDIAGKVQVSVDHRDLTADQLICELAGRN